MVFLFLKVEMIGFVLFPALVQNHTKKHVEPSAVMHASFPGTIFKKCVRSTTGVKKGATDGGLTQVAPPCPPATPPPQWRGRYGN